MHALSTFTLLLSIFMLWYGVATDSDILMLVGLFVLISSAASF